MRNLDDLVDVPVICGLGFGLFLRGKCGWPNG